MSYNNGPLWSSLYKIDLYSDLYAIQYNLKFAKKKFYISAIIFKMSLVSKIEKQNMVIKNQKVIINDLFEIMDKKDSEMEKQEKKMENLRRDNARLIKLLREQGTDRKKLMWRNFLTRVSSETQTGR